jgi:hypothetical protein
MKQKWGREDDAGEFPSDKAVWIILLCSLCSLSLVTATCGCGLRSNSFI